MPEIRPSRTQDGTFMCSEMCQQHEFLLDALLGGRFSRYVCKVDGSVHQCRVDNLCLPGAIYDLNKRLHEHLNSKTYTIAELEMLSANGEVW